MIPVWLLTTLHYVSLAAGVAILLLLAWQLALPDSDDSGPRMEAAGREPSGEAGTDVNGSTAAAQQAKAPEKE